MSSDPGPLEGRLREHLRDQYAAYNAAYSHRLDVAGPARLRQARLDLLLALAQVGEPLTADLLQQATADATVVLHVDDEEGEDRPDGAPQVSEARSRPLAHRGT